MSFPVLEKKMQHSNLLVFFDFEGTQFSHKAIALGIYAVKKERGSIKADGEVIQYHTLIHCEDTIGDLVQEMTGITLEMLVHAKSMHEVILEVTKLLRPYSKTYISYGNNDIRMLVNSINKDDETEMNFFNHVVKNYIDFQRYLQKRVVDSNGKSMSINRLCTLFDIHEEGKEHDPLVDSLLLKRIYEEYISDEEKAVDLVLKNYQKNPYTNEMDKSVTSLLISKNEVNLDDLRKVIKRNL